MFTNHIYLICMYKEDLVLTNNCWHTIKPNQTKPEDFNLNPLILGSGLIQPTKKKKQTKNPESFTGILQRFITLFLSKQTGFLLSMSKRRTLFGPSPWLIKRYTLSEGTRHGLSYVSVKKLPSFVKIKMKLFASSLTTIVRLVVTWIPCRLTSESSCIEERFKGILIIIFRQRSECDWMAPNEKRKKNNGIGRSKIR